MWDYSLSIDPKSEITKKKKKSFLKSLIHVAKKISKRSVPILNCNGNILVPCFITYSPAMDDIISFSLTSASLVGKRLYFDFR